CNLPLLPEFVGEASAAPMHEGVPGTMKALPVLRVGEDLGVETSHGVERPSLTPPLVEHATPLEIEAEAAVVEGRSVDVPMPAEDLRDLGKAYRGPTNDMFLL
ncbi:hypothetical protein LTR53_018200, partial [Teratosphaeriaceae sp. CCFEE 6253]